ncbi:hypothetical protein [Streptosporangium sp. NPDC004631]
MTPAAPPPGPRRKAHQARTPRESQENGENGPPGENEERQPPEHKDRRIREAWEAQRAALADAFPTWKIVCVADLSIPLWFALYREPLTPQQEQAGFRPTMLRGSAEDLQAELALRCRVTRPLPPLPTPR